MWRVRTLCKHLKSVDFNVLVPQQNNMLMTLIENEKQRERERERLIQSITLLLYNKQDGHVALNRSTELTNDDASLIVQPVNVRCYSKNLWSAL